MIKYKTSYKFRFDMFKVLLENSKPYILSYILLYVFSMIPLSASTR